MADSKGIQQLDLNLLKVFQSLYVEQNMTRTAEILHITPSAVSHAIQRLREALDDPLFRRSQNKMLPTPACQRMAPAIIETLSRLQQILQQWGNFEPQSSEHNFTIGMHDALEPSVLPGLATSLARLAPKITFSSVKFERPNLLKELASGQLDMAIDVALPVRPPLLQKKLIENEFVVMMRRQNPLANSLDKQTYLAAQHLNVSNRPSGMTVEDTLIQEQNLVRHISIRCQSYFAAKEILKNSDQLLTVPRLLAAQFIDSNLTLRPMPFSIRSLATHLYWHESTDQDLALNWLRAVVTDLFVR